jgi:hypothetical protein
MCDDADFLKLERSLMEEETRKSPERLDLLLADEFREFGRSGTIYGKRQIIELMCQEEPVRRTIAEFTVKQIAENVALITYRSSRTDENSGIELESLRSSLWRKNGAQWQLLFHQGTPLNP